MLFPFSLVAQKVCLCRVVPTIFDRSEVCVPVREPSELRVVLILVRPTGHRTPPSTPRRRGPYSVEGKVPLFWVCGDTS